MKIAAALIGLLLVALPGYGHEVRPAYLGISEREANTFDVLWKQPLLGYRRLPLEPELPPHCTLELQHVGDVQRAALIQQWTADCGAEGLVGHRVGIEGLSRTLTDVLVNVTFTDGTTLQRLLRPEDPRFTVEVDDGPQIFSYLVLGIEHLLLGVDHILFVIGLMFFISKPSTLIKTITGFTVAHSITLGLSALEIVRLSQPPVEAVIALSIMFLAVERLRGATDTITARHTWIVALVFGLLHGFGFAGALLDIGLPKTGVLWALFLFNVGVEIGQLIVVALALAIVVMVRRTQVKLPQWVVNAPLWAMGTVASYWLVARVALL
ncbi:MAG: HupE/UreJ family protein [Gammaproteobacteria bacterium]|nr:HupE/UreJ family protein [Gammaproteobacteria bacterium]